MTRNPRPALVLMLLAGVLGLVVLLWRGPETPEKQEPVTSRSRETRRASGPEGAAPGGAASRHERGAREARDHEPVSAAEAAETTRRLLERNRADIHFSAPRYDSDDALRAAISRMSRAQLETLMRAEADAPEFYFSNSPYSLDFFPLVALARLQPMAAVNLYDELWPAGKMRGAPQFQQTLQEAAAGDPQAVFDWFRDQEGTRDAGELTVMRYPILAGALQNDVSLGLSLISQAGVTEYQVLGSRLTDLVTDSEMQIDAGSFLAGMRRLVTTLSPEEGDSFRQGALTRIGLVPTASEDIDTHLAKWPLLPEEMPLVLGSLLTNHPKESLAWLTGDSLSPQVQEARQFYLESHSADSPEVTAQIRARLK